MNAALRALVRSRRAFGEGPAERRLALLEALDRARLRSAREVLRLHEALCFLRAYPDDARVLSRVERMLARFHRRADLRRHRGSLADTGIAGTAVRYRFFWPTARWLARRWPDRLELDRRDAAASEAIAKALPLLVTPAEAEALRVLDLGGFEALDRLRGRETGATFFVRRVETMPGDSRTREAFFDGIDAGFVLEPGPDTPSRTRARRPGAPAALPAAPLRRGRPDLRVEIRRPPRRVRAVSVAEGRRLLDLARGAMVTRQRDLDAFAYGDPRDVRIVDDGEGLAFLVCGVIPERRALLHAIHGGLILRNGVPIGYLQADVIGRAAAVSFNIFETYRGGEAAYLFARMLAMLRRLFGARSFHIDPYQLGKGNEEGIESGAWWFYYKMGFRPRAAGARRILRAELARRRAMPGRRSSKTTLRKLAEWHLFFDLDPRRRASLPPVAALGARVARDLGERAGADRERAVGECVREAMRLTGVRSMDGFTPDERLAWRRWAPVLPAIPGVSRWSPAERRALARVIRAKGGRRESDFVALFNAHPRLERALLGRSGP